MENYEWVCQIGKGNFGCISKIIRKSDKKVLVWKELNYGQMSEKEKEQIVSEVNILRELKHPNIVRYYDRIIDKKHSKIYIIMEYCEGGDLGQLIKRCKKSGESIGEDVIWKIFTQVLLAVHVIHNHKEGKILHRDIKPSNIFLDKENNLKLGDFGLSRELSSESHFAYSHVGTPYYMSPEQIDENRYNEKSDIWSLGCFLYEITTFKPPFEAKNQIMLAMRIKSGKVDKIDRKYSEELWRVITWMLTVNPDKRPNSDELLNIPEVCIRLREKRINNYMSKIKSNEEKMLLKEKELAQREQEVMKKEQDISNKEAKFTERENTLYLRETQVKQKELELIQKEQEMQAKIRELNEKEKALLDQEKKIKSSSIASTCSSKFLSSNAEQLNSGSIGLTSQKSSQAQSFNGTSSTHKKNNSISTNYIGNFNVNNILNEHINSNNENDEVNNLLLYSNSLGRNSLSKDQITNNNTNTSINNLDRIKNTDNININLNTKLDNNLVNNNLDNNLVNNKLINNNLVNSGIINESINNNLANYQAVIRKTNSNVEKINPMSSINLNLSIEKSDSQNYKNPNFFSTNFGKAHNKLQIAFDENLSNLPNYTSTYGQNINDKVQNNKANMDINKVTSNTNYQLKHQSKIFSKNVSQSSNNLKDNEQVISTTNTSINQISNYNNFATYNSFLNQKFSNIQNSISNNSVHTKYNPPSSNRALKEKINAYSSTRMTKTERFSTPNNTNISHNKLNANNIRSNKNFTMNFTNNSNNTSNTNITKKNIYSDFKKSRTIKTSNSFKYDTTEEKITNYSSVKQKTSNNSSVNSYKKNISNTNSNVNSTFTHQTYSKKDDNKRSNTPKIGKLLRRNNTTESNTTPLKFNKTPMTDSTENINADLNYYYLKYMNNTNRIPNTASNQKKTYLNSDMGKPICNTIGGKMNSSFKIKENSLGQ